MEEAEPVPHAPRGSAEPDPLASWVALVAQGDEAALKALYDATSARVLGLAQQILHDPSSAEEALIDVYTQIWKQAGRYEPWKGSVTTWICTLARTRSIDLRRQRQRHAAREAAFSPELLEIVRDPGASPIESAHAGDRAQIVQRALATLPREQRRVVEAAFFGGLSHTEIADTLGQPLGTVKTRIRSGLAALRQALAPAEGEVA